MIPDGHNVYICYFRDQPTWCIAVLVWNYTEVTGVIGVKEIVQLCRNKPIVPTLHLCEDTDKHTSYTNKPSHITIGVLYRTSLDISPVQNATLNATTR